MTMITEPIGVLPGIPIDDYHRSRALSASGLANFALSPLHYYSRHLDPDRPSEPEKPGQLEGTLAHCLILEPDQFEKRYAVGPCDDRRLKSWKAWEEGITDRICIRPSEHIVAACQSQSVLALPEVARLLSEGAPELSAFWTDPGTGVYCRCRPDWTHPTERGAILLDVKTCAIAKPDAFALQISRKAYARQAAWYSMGWTAASGDDVLGFVFVAVESTWPFAACAIMLDDDWLNAARAEIRSLLPRFAECQRTDTWPGYSDGIELLTMPHWMHNQAIEGGYL